MLNGSVYQRAVQDTTRKIPFLVLTHLPVHVYYRLLNDVKALICIYPQCSSDNQIRIHNKLRDAFELYNRTWAIGRHAEDFLRSIGDLPPYSGPCSTQVPDLFYNLD
ncbi:hypothetical protein C1645_836175 [Glomus cerebriforme]|uniref:Uncharacterized protein n=1 Tax=Glomus cerebriforme TaxID=658196 RepID=A0A397SD48_9GLOM|nr:hypothetical protein C1645_836175 [Glomus cerebriforme]